MVVNSAMDTKSFSRKGHIERVDLWKKVERFMAGWPATEMPRQGVRARRAWWGVASSKQWKLGLTCFPLKVLAV